MDGDVNALPLTTTRGARLPRQGGLLPRSRLSRLRLQCDHIRFHCLPYNAPSPNVAYISYEIWEILKQIIQLSSFKTRALARAKTLKKQVCGVCRVKMLLAVFWFSSSLGLRFLMLEQIKRLLEPAIPSIHKCSALLRNVVHGVKLSCAGEILFTAFELGL